MNEGEIGKAENRGRIKGDRKERTSKREKYGLGIAYVFTFVFRFNAYPTYINICRLS